MRAPTEVTPDELREAHNAADTLISERFRSYLPGRMLPMLLGKFRDDVAESLGMELPPLPQRSGPVKVVKLDGLRDQPRCRTPRLPGGARGRP
jgi:hypothetical protein